VYDCRIKPVQTDKASTARILYIEYKDYIDRWDEIASIFSKDAVLKGSFDKYVESTKLKRGTAEVDDAFLAEIEQWRDELARNIALRNPKLSTRQLNFAVQKTIDRIIFLRICEDRGIEGYGRLQSIMNGANIYKRLTQLFRDADDRYNSGLFHFKKEKGREEPPDDLTLNLTIDNDKLKRIIKDIYYPDSPYEFSVLPADILGQVYEQFLGKVIRLTKAHYAKVEEKPEVRKAGGVYYTPTYIVDYIVSNTVGKLCKGKTPAQAAKLRILDPACGSGSFLLGAYQYLLDWHRDYYIEDGPEKHRKQLYQVTEREWRLSTEERKRILLNNIYGVDIDLQAVEVTKLSLLLKVLEGESEETLKRQLAIFHQRALPDLGSNIKCGNSLIGLDFYQGKQADMFDDEAQYRINAFDWEVEFKDIMDAGGFDAVIGNPPYRSLLLGRKQESEDKEIISYYSNKYPHAAQYKMNLFGLFMEKCIKLLTPKGEFSFIIPNLFFTSFYFQDLRKLMIEEGSLSRIVDLRYKVFPKAELGGSGIFVFTPNKRIRKAVVETANSYQVFNTPETTIANREIFLKAPQFNLLMNPKVIALLDRIKQKPCVPLGSICTVYQGIITGDNKQFLSTTPTGKKWEKVIRGRDIDRYFLEFGGHYVFYAPEKLWSNTNPQMFKVSGKLISRQTSDRLRATIDTEKYLTLDSTHVIHLKEPLFSLKYFLGIYNSKLLNFLYVERVKESGRTFAQVKVVNLKPLPIRTIDFDDPEDKKRHDTMVKLVERMLDLNKKLAQAKVPDTKKRLQRQIDYTNSEIDKLVYELYDLSEEEIKIVEGVK
ncbi:N-6 DNA methylase, partial [candidate division WOR-3 bacterium]|nr:N-6 DNA methylase [candidate division WOR-3 bacterium]